MLAQSNNAAGGFFLLLIGIAAVLVIVLVIMWILLPIWVNQIAKQSKDALAEVKAIRTLLAAGINVTAYAPPPVKVEPSKSLGDAYRQPSRVSDPLPEPVDGLVELSKAPPSVPVRKAPPPSIPQRPKVRPPAVAP